MKITLGFVFVFLSVGFPDDTEWSFRRLPEGDKELYKPEFSDLLGLRWCTDTDCDKPFKNELEAIPESEQVVLVIGDLERLFENRKLTLRLATSCVQMKYTTILLRWNEFQPNYFQAVANSHLIAVQMANHIIGKRRNIHMIGMGMGAHIAGFIGKRCKSGGLIHRITGLDPPRILFEYNYGPHEIRLSHTDANFVDVYHSDYKGKMRVGFILKMGTVDLYQLGGGGCKVVGSPEGDSMFYWNQANESIKSLISICQHNLAIVNFIQSMYKNCMLWAVRNLKDPCVKDNCIALGFMAQDYVLDKNAGGGNGSYMYNSAMCYSGVPNRTISQFAQIYNNFRNKHDFINNATWFNWLLNRHNTGVNMGVNYVESFD